MQGKELKLLLITFVSGLELAKPGNMGNVGHHGKDVRKDVPMKPKNLGHHIVQQGECMEGWVDASSVGLGCLLADVFDIGAEEPVADQICRAFGESARLVEIENEEQMSFLQSMLSQLEEELGITDGFIWYWIGLNDMVNEGEWVWPVHGLANYTYWDVEYDEPYPDPDHERNCAMMQSARFNLLWQTYWCDDGYDLVPLCQLP